MQPTYHRQPWRHVRCSVCGAGFTQDSWSARYTNEQGDTCHGRCRRGEAGLLARQLRRLAAIEACMQETDR